MVVGGIREGVHAILADLHPLGRPELAALCRSKLTQILENLHRVSSRRNLGALRHPYYL
jgi:hypothetical protein